MGLQSVGLHSRATDFGFRNVFIARGPYSLAQPILMGATHSLNWGLQSVGLQAEGLQSRATVFESRNVLIAVTPKTSLFFLGDSHSRDGTVTKFTQID